MSAPCVDLLVNRVAGIAVAISTYFSPHDTPTTVIYTLSLHDALPIWADAAMTRRTHRSACWGVRTLAAVRPRVPLANRSEEHTSELQSRGHLVCRLLLEKKKLRLTHQSGQHRRRDEAGVHGVGDEPKR